MPYRQKWVSPDVFLTHKGVTIYHIYKDNDYENGPRTYWFTTDEEGGEGDVGEFDVRELPGVSAKLNGHPPFMTGPEFHDRPANEREAIAAAWKEWQGGGEERIIRESIIAAIDASIITKEGVPV